MGGGAALLEESGEARGVRFPRRSTAWIGGGWRRRSDLAEGAILTRAAPSSALRGLKALDPSWVEDSSGMIYLQGWIYDPAILGKRGEADPLSVALTLRDVEDERLQAAVFQMLEGVFS